MMTNSKLCPLCRHSMYITRFNNHEVDQCPKCAGIWFDRAEIDAQFNKIARRTTQRHCPCCHGRLLEADLLNGHGVKVDICPDSHGAFVDYDEINHVKHSAVIQEAIKQIELKPTTKAWLFQFFTLMPIEYNIQPKSKPAITYLLLVANVLFFLLMIDAGFTSTLFQEWGFIPARLADIGQLYTLITSQFIHGGWAHLIGNMYFLYVIGDNIEDVLGKAKFITTYLALGVAGCLAHWAFNSTDFTPMVGASGAISGLFGMYIVLFRRAMLTQMFFVFQLKLPAWVYFAIWFGLNLLGQLAGGDGVAYMAHIGGFIAGAVFAWLAYPSLTKQYPIIACLNSGYFIARYKKAKIST